MASEILAVSENNLPQVIAVIRAGIAASPPNVSAKVKGQLSKWCDEEEAYLERIKESD